MSDFSQSEKKKKPGFIGELMEEFGLTWKKIFGYGFLIIFVFALLSVLWGGWGITPVGHRGVLKRYGRVTGDVKGEGFYLKLPWLEGVKYMNVRVQKEQVETEGASHDLQSVKTIVALNINAIPLQTPHLYQHYGEQYMETVVAPAMQETVKAVMAKYTAEELITKREDVRAAMASAMDAKLQQMGLQTSAMNIVNFDFSEAFDHAIEAKVTAEQNALAAKNLLAQKKFEAEQAVATAEGKAKAIALESQAVATNPSILKLRALERWDGVMPKIMGSGAVLPFLDISKELEPAKQ